MKEFFKAQKKLDDIIIANVSKRLHKEVSHIQFINQRLLSVDVEVGEFLKENNPELKKLEFADIHHFLMSCGLALEINDCIEKHSIDEIYNNADTGNYEDAVINFMINFSDFTNNIRSFKYWSLDQKPRNIEKHYYKCFVALFTIAKTMGYSIEDIKKVYYIKNAKNIERQKNKY